MLISYTPSRRPALPCPPQLGIFSEAILSQWPSCTRFYLADLWGHQENYQDVANVGQAEQVRAAVLQGSPGGLLRWLASNVHWGAPALPATGQHNGASPNSCWLPPLPRQLAWPTRSLSCRAAQESRYQKVRQRLQPFEDKVRCLPPVSSAPTAKGWPVLSRAAVLRRPASLD